MTRAEIETEALRLSTGDLRQLIGILISEKMRREGVSEDEFSRRVDDKSSGAWISLKEAKERLKGL